MSRLALALVLCAAAPAIAERWEDLPHPPRGEWVTDTTGALGDAARSQANARAAAVAGAGRGQLAVVVVNTVGDENPRAWGTRLFNRWGVGDEQRNDGILLLIAVADRKAEIVLGAGIDGPEWTRQTDRIMEEAVVSNMKRGRLDDAVVQASVALAALLEHPPSPVSASNKGTSWGGMWIAGGVVLVVVGFFAGPGLRRRVRLRVRKCERCGAPRRLLGEAEDDQHLTSGQVAEEEVGAVDYDVWYCAPCDSALVVPHRTWFAHTKRCNACRYRTLVTESHTRHHATYDATGMMEIIARCGSCGYENSTWRTIPASASSGGSSSFGGGSSSGGGSSGSW